MAWAEKTVLGRFNPSTPGHSCDARLDPVTGHKFAVAVAAAAVAAAATVATVLC